MKTVLEVICKVKGWRGGTIHQAIAEYKQTEGRRYASYD